MFFFVEEQRKPGAADLETSLAGEAEKTWLSRSFSYDTSSLLTRGTPPAIVVLTHGATENVVATRRDTLESGAFIRDFASAPLAPVLSQTRGPLTDCYVADIFGHASL